MSKMIKHADLMETLRDLGSNISKQTREAGSSLSNWYGNINPDTRSALKRGLIGAGVGGALTGGMALATPRDPESSRRKSVVGPALLGALLGGGAAAGIPYGLKTIGGGIKLKGEQRQPLVTRTLDKLVAPFGKHLGPTVGGIAGGVGMAKTQPAWGPAWQAAKSKGIPAGNPGHILGVAAKSQKLPARVLQTLKGTKGLKGKAGLLGIPLGIMGGALAQRYAKGELY